MPASKRVKRQSSSSFNVLSPNSQQARVENMRKTIRALQLKSDDYSKRIERLVANDVQNMEIEKLVDTIINSQDGQQRLAEVFSEAHNVKKEREMF